MNTATTTEATGWRRLVVHPLRVRRLTVVSIVPLTLRLWRVRLGGADLDGFTTLAPDDHVRVLFPPAGTGEPPLPDIRSGRIVWPKGGPSAITRDYTPVGFDPRARTLDLEVVLHDGGHATAWIHQARPGTVLGVAGPRGSHVLAKTPDTLLMAGDETALPAMARWLSELPAGVRVQAFIEVQDEGDWRPLPTAAFAAVHWLYRGTAAAGTTELLLDAVRAAPQPVAATYVWLAGEAQAVQGLRRYLCDQCGVPRSALTARGYWKRGAQDHQEPHDD